MTPNQFLSVPLNGLENYLLYSFLKKTSSNHNVTYNNGEEKRTSCRLYNISIANSIYMS